MSKIPLKIVVAGRTYPLTVNEGEESKILKAAEDINRAIKL
jgi:cell division protein ZapA